MKVTETITRECCAEKDLKPVQDCEKVNFNIPTIKFCIHCGWRHYYTSFMDPSGSRDYSYVKETKL